MRKRETKKKKKKGLKMEKRETKFFILFIGLVYIILINYM